MSKASRPNPKTANASLENALALHKTGQFAAAAVAYEQALARAPEEPQILYLLGGAYAQSGRLADAIPKLEHSLKLRPGFLPAIELMGSIWGQLKEPAKAIPYFREAAAQAPNSPDIFTRLGAALFHCGNYGDAAAALSRALALDPKNRQTRIGYAAALGHTGREAEAEGILRQCVSETPEPNSLIALGTLLGQCERFGEAEAVFQEAITRDPKSATAYQLLGHAFHKQGRLQEAESAYRSALALAPNDAKLLERLGENLTDLNRLDEAQAILERANQIAPNGADTITALGRIHELRGALDEATALHTRALSLDPKNTSALLNRGNARRFAGDFSGALIDYDAAIAARPGLAQANANRALALLALGRLDEAWPLFRARIRALHGAPDLTNGKPWDGSSLAGKRVLVWNEYGLGDEILFASLLPELIKIVASCTVVCAPRLLTLFRRSFPDAHVVPLGTSIADDFDFCMPLIDAAQTLRPSLASFPQHAGYLRPDTDLTAKLRARYQDRTAKRLVGISWRSNAGATGRFKSNDLTQWARILEIPNTRFVSLQYGDCTADIERAQTQLGCNILVDPQIDPAGDLDPFTAQVAAMDVIVSVSNTTVHVAGGLGKPVLTLLPTGPGMHW